MTLQFLVLINETSSKDLLRNFSSKVKCRGLKRWFLQRILVEFSKPMSSISSPIPADPADWMTLLVITRIAL